MSHTCLWPGCRVVVLDSMWGCRGHWSQLPQKIRTRIGRAYRDGIDTNTHPSRQWFEAHNAALAWIEAQFDEVHDARHRVQ